MKVLLILSTLAMVTGKHSVLPDRYGSKGTKGVGKGNAYSLIPPSFVNTARASKVMSKSAFPVDKTRISDSVNTSQEIDRDKRNTILIYKRG